MFTSFSKYVKKTTIVWLVLVSLFADFIVQGKKNLIQVALKQEKIYTGIVDIENEQQRDQQQQNQPLIKKMLKQNKQRILLNHPLENYNNIQYMGNIFMGKDQQQFKVMFDTGSDWLWIPGQNTTSKNKRHCQEQSMYSYNNSQEEFHNSNSSCALLTNPHEIQYGKGFVKGKVALDLISFSEEDQQEVGAFFLSVNEHRNLQGYQADGVFGLGFKEVQKDGNNEEYESYLSILQQEKLIDQKVFAFYLNNNNFNNDNNPYLKNSMLTIGGYDESYIQEGKQIEWFPVVDSNYWSIKISDIFLGDNQISEKPIKGMVDTGSSLIIMPKSHFQKMKKVLEQTYEKKCKEVESGHLICSCPQGEVDSFPTFQLGFEDESGQTKNFQIEPSDYILQDRSQCEILLTYFEGLSNLNNNTYSEQRVNLADQNGFNYTHASNSTNSTMSEYWILGDIFIRKYYSIFDLDNKRIGFAEAIQQEYVVKDLYNYNLYMLLGLLLTGLIGGIIINYIINLKYVQKDKQSNQSYQLNASQNTNNKNNEIINNDEPTQRLV